MEPKYSHTLIFALLINAVHSASSGKHFEYSEREVFFLNCIFYPDECEEIFEEIRQTETLLTVMLVCVGISQTAIVLVMILRPFQSPEKMAVKKGGNKQIKNVAAKLSNFTFKSVKSDDSSVV